MMKIKLIIGVLITFTFQQLIIGQNLSYKIIKTSFSSDNYDEFSPVYYKNGLVFISNRSQQRIMTYSTAQDKSPFKINFVEKVPAGIQVGLEPGIKSGEASVKKDTFPEEIFQDAILFSKDLETKLNDGPVTFSSKGDTIYYSRNVEIEGKLSTLSSSRNKLGLFSAVFDGENWIKIKELRINNEWYNITTPWLSPDCKKLFFASDKPGGYGGSDIYYSLWNKEFWNDPVNLGSVINTKGNESYPFLNPSGELYFASDGHPGLGGKDIYFSRVSDSIWVTPIPLEAPINSQYDDFGIITDTLMNSGYFSSNREKSVDIYKFQTVSPQIFYNDIQKKNQHCFIFRDTGSIVIDTVSLSYKWDFGDGNKATGAEVSHCYSEAGFYKVKLDIIEKKSGNLFFSKLEYNIELNDFEQAYIESPEISIIGEPIDFNGTNSFLPGYEITDYSWDFGDGNKNYGGKVKHSFKTTGEYKVNLSLILKSEINGSMRKTGISKKITILNDKKEQDAFLAKTSDLKKELPDIRNFPNTVLDLIYSAENDFEQDAIFSVAVLSSKNKVDLTDSDFKNIPKKYSIREEFNDTDSIYNYVVDQQMSLMATYPAYSEMVALGFTNTQIKIIILKEPEEKELHNLIKIYGAFADSYFDSSDRLTSNAYIMLDQIVKLMNKYPSMRLEVAVHSDNTGSAATSLALSQKRSLVLVNYIVSRGINTKRLTPVGYGESKPIATNFLEKDRKLNRRIDFKILNL